MKRKDIGIILLVAILSSFISIILSGAIISTPEDRRQKVEVVEALSTEFQRPDSTYFNSRSVNPAKRIQIGQDPDSKPFEEQ